MKKDLFVGLAFIAMVGSVVVAHQWFPQFMMWRLVNRYLIHILMVSFALGLLAAALNKNRIMLMSFAIAAMLSIYLKERSTGLFQRVRARDGDMVVTALHMNLSAASDIEAVLTALTDVKPDVLTLQELTPDWYAALRDTLGALYPTKIERIGFDMFSMGVYSHYKLIKADTITTADLSWLQVTLRSSRRDTFSVASVFLMPQINPYGYELVQNQVSRLSRSINSLAYPVLLMGDFNLLPWSDELFRLRQLTGMLDVRVNYLPQPSYGESFFASPVDYIYHSPAMAAIAHGEISKGKNGHLGVWGNFQFKSAYDIAPDERY